MKTPKKERNKKDVLLLDIGDRIAITNTVVSCSAGLSAYENTIAKNQQVIMNALIYILTEPI